jgi:transposase-like protein
MTYQAQCKCGYHSQLFGARQTAEVDAEFHEVTKTRRTYQHDTVVVGVLAS